MHCAEISIYAKRAGFNEAAAIQLRMRDAAGFDRNEGFLLQ